MSKNPIPKWYYEGIKAIQWLEEKREKNDAFYTPLGIAGMSGVSLQIVELTLENAGEMIERKGNRARFNMEWRIKETLNQLIREGLMKESKPGQFSLTKAGELYAQNLIMTDPKAAALIRKLAKG